MANPNPPIENLKPFKPGQSGNPKGAKPGTKHLKTIIAEFLDDGKLDWKKIPLKDSAKLQKIYGKNGWQAITGVAVSQAIAGDRHAREWLRKAQYGDKITHGFEDDFFTETELTIKVVRAEHDTGTERSSDGGEGTT